MKQWLTWLVFLSIVGSGAAIALNYINIDVNFSNKDDPNTITDNPGLDNGTIPEGEINLRSYDLDKKIELPQNTQSQADEQTSFTYSTLNYSTTEVVKYINDKVSNPEVQNNHNYRVIYVGTTFPDLAYNGNMFLKVSRIKFDDTLVAHYLLVEYEGQYVTTNGNTSLMWVKTGNQSEVDVSVANSTGPYYWNLSDLIVDNSVSAIDIKNANVIKKLLTGGVDKKNSTDYLDSNENPNKQKIEEEKLNLTVDDFKIETQKEANNQDVPVLKLTDSGLQKLKNKNYEVDALTNNPTEIAKLAYQLKS